LTVASSSTTATEPQVIAGEPSVDAPTSPLGSSVVMAV